MPKKGELGQFANLSGGGGRGVGRKSKVAFLMGGTGGGGWLILQCTQRNEIETYNSAISALSC